MPAIDSLLKRLGFVKLARYGLVLTPEGRIMSLRPAILEDGLGGRIVGWPDGDLAAMELQKWEPARPAPKAAVATRLAVAPPPIPMPKAAVVIASPGGHWAPTAPVAQPVEVEEDDWEWEIALARARVAAEEVEQAVAAPRAQRTRLPTVPPPIAQPVLAVVKIPALEVAPLPTFPKTEPLTTIEYEDRSSPSNEIVQVARITNRPAVPAERPLASPVGVRKPVATIPPLAAASKRPGTSPPTIIPIPKLPSIKGRQSQIQPVLGASSRPSRTRFAKGTGPVVETKIGVPPPPNNDRTEPGILLPRAAASVSLPSSLKRR